jgi:phosphatidylserine decarboxylase
LFSKGGPKRVALFFVSLAARYWKNVAPVNTLTRDRQTGAIATEHVHQARELEFLYERPLGKLLARHIVTRPWFSQLYALRYRRRRTPAEIAAFAAALGIVADEAERPLTAYRTIDELFTRRLAASARPIDRAPERLVSPADARVLVAPRLAGGTLPIKGARVGVEELVADATLAARYRDGAAYVLRLALADYHRFHFPDGGTAGPPRPVAGRLHSVHPIALRAGAPSFQNQRTVTVIQTDGFGAVTMVEIGALSVGTIEQTFQPGRVERGHEKGTFRFGGSTIVLLLEPGRVTIDPDLAEASSVDRADAVETRVRMGTGIGRCL